MNRQLQSVTTAGANVCFPTLLNQTRFIYFCTRYPGELQGFDVSTNPCAFQAHPDHLDSKLPGHSEHLNNTSLKHGVYLVSMLLIVVPIALTGVD